MNLIVSEFLSLDGVMQAPGDTDEDRSENEYSLEHGCRLLSVYHTSAGVKFWIITEADRSATTILLPEEY